MILYNIIKCKMYNLHDIHDMRGAGLAASVSGVTRITDKMLYLAAKACTDSMTPGEMAEGRTFPNIQRIREASLSLSLSPSLPLSLPPSLPPSLPLPLSLSLSRSLARSLARSPFRTE
jgi:hypothetical protein